MFSFPDISAVNLMVRWNLLACSIKCCHFSSHGDSMCLETILSIDLERVLVRNEVKYFSTGSVLGLVGYSYGTNHVLHSISVPSS